MIKRLRVSLEFTDIAPFFILEPRAKDTVTARPYIAYIATQQANVYLSKKQQTQDVRTLPNFCIVGGFCLFWDVKLQTVTKKTASTIRGVDSLVQHPLYISASV